VVNYDGVIVESCSGALLNIGHFILVKKDESDKLVVSRIVDITHKVAIVVKMGKTSTKTLTEVVVTPPHTVVQEPSIGRTPILEDHFQNNEEVYQSKWRMVVSIKNIKLYLNKMFIKNDILYQGAYGNSYKKLYIISWCWTFICMHVKVSNHRDTVHIERDRKEGCIHYHGTLEASHQTYTSEGLRFGMDVLFESFRSLVGKFAGVAVHTPPST
jgi:hypothetical protein